MEPRFLIEEGKLQGSSVDIPSLSIQRCVIGSGLIAQARDLLAELGLGHRLAIVCDVRTRDAAGGLLEQYLAQHHIIRPIILPGHPAADMQTAQAVQQAARDYDAVLAVGSGVINDLTKYAAHANGQPYAVFATALSMNGYASANASLEEHGHKRSFTATPPRGIYIDLDVMAAAPRRLAQSGFGDSICRSTAQIDWLLSHLLHGTTYDARPFALLAPKEGELLARAGGIGRGESNALALLAETLVLSGIGMTLSNGSYPASQGEHMIAHTLKLMQPEATAGCYHGEQVAVASLTMAKLQEKLLRGKRAPLLHPHGDYLQKMEAYFGKERTAELLTTYQRKYLNAKSMSQLNDRLQKEWPLIRNKLEAVRRPAGEMEEALRKVGTPTLPSHIGLTPQQYDEAVAHAHFTRERFTFLDLAYYA